MVSSERAVRQSWKCKHFTSRLLCCSTVRFPSLSPQINLYKVVLGLQMLNAKLVNAQQTQQVTPQIHWPIQSDLRDRHLLAQITECTLC